MFNIWFIILILLMKAQALGQNADFLSPRSQGLAGTLSVFANGLEAVFYNPAGIGANHGTTDNKVKELHYPFVSIGSSDQNQTINQELRSKMDTAGDPSPGASLSTASFEEGSQMGQLSFVPNIQAGRLIVAPLYDLQVARFPLAEPNSIRFLHQETLGVLGGFSIASSEEDLRIGVAGGFLQRTRIDGVVDLQDVLASEDRKEILSPHKKSYTSTPIHAGIQWRMGTVHQPTLGVVVHHLGDTVHSSASSTHEVQQTQQDLRVGFGLAPTINTGGSVRWSVEMQSLLSNQKIPLTRKIHTGLEWHSNDSTIQNSVFGLRAGYSYDSYGLGAHLSMGLINLQYSLRFLPNGYHEYTNPSDSNKSELQFHSFALIIDLAG